jgi:transcriptional antiterminator RfaH
MQTRWYVVLSRPKEEKRAFDNLIGQGFQACYPRCRVPGGMVRPLFVNYLFVAFDIADRKWEKIPSTRGVKRLLGAGENPVPIRDRELDAIRAELVEDIADFSKPAVVDHGLVAGDMVRVEGGPFTGYQGRVARSDKVLIHVEIFCFQRWVVVPVLAASVSLVISQGTPGAVAIGSKISMA